MFDEILVNVLLVLLCYVYIVIVIFVSGKLDQLLHISRKASRKFLHAMIGNLPFVIPLFYVEHLSSSCCGSLHSGYFSCFSVHSV